MKLPKILKKKHLPKIYVILGIVFLIANIFISIKFLSQFTPIPTLRPRAFDANVQKCDYNIEKVEFETVSTFSSPLLSGINPDQYICKVMVNKGSVPSDQDVYINCTNISDDFPCSFITAESIDSKRSALYYTCDYASINQVTATTFNPTCLTDEYPQHFQGGQAVKYYSGPSTGGLATPPSFATPTTEPTATAYPTPESPTSAAAVNPNQCTIGGTTYDNNSVIAYCADIHCDTNLNEWVYIDQYCENSQSKFLPGGKTGISCEYPKPSCPGAGPTLTPSPIIPADLDSCYKAVDAGTISSSYQDCQNAYGTPTPQPLQPSPTPVVSEPGASSCVNGYSLEKVAVGSAYTYDDGNGYGFDCKITIAKNAGFAGGDIPISCFSFYSGTDPSIGNAACDKYVSYDDTTSTYTFRCYPEKNVWPEINSFQLKASSPDCGPIYSPDPLITPTQPDQPTTTPKPTNVPTPTDTTRTGSIKLDVKVDGTAIPARTDRARFLKFTVGKVTGSSPDFTFTKLQDIYADASTAYPSGGYNFASFDNLAADTYAVVIDDTHVYFDPNDSGSYLSGNLKNIYFAPDSLQFTQSFTSTLGPNCTQDSISEYCILDMKYNTTGRLNVFVSLNKSILAPY